MDIAKLSARKLNELLEKRDVEKCRLRDAVIAAGFGEWRGNELREFAKGSSLLSKVVLVREYLAASDAWQEANAELDARRRYHGGDKPIKRSVLA